MKLTLMHHHHHQQPETWHIKLITYYGGNIKHKVVTVHLQGNKLYAQETTTNLEKVNSCSKYSQPGNGTT